MFKLIINTFTCKVDMSTFSSIKHGTSPDGKPCTIVTTTDHLKVMRICQLYISSDKCNNCYMYPGGGEGTRYIKKVGMLVENFEIDP